MTILIIEDNKASARFIEIILQKDALLEKIHEALNAESTCDGV